VGRDEQQPVEHFGVAGARQNEAADAVADTDQL